MMKSSREFLCDFYPNAIRDLNHFHGLWAIGLGWGYFIWGVPLHWDNILDLRVVMLHGFIFASWTCSFLMVINIYKMIKRIAIALEKIADK